MSRRPKPKKCEETGKGLVNGASAKSGSNKALLGADLGQTRQFTRYKLAEQSKVMILVPPRHTSQEYSECGHIHKDNRPTQALFYCVKCGHTENADDNAAKVIKTRGIKRIHSEAFSEDALKTKGHQATLL